MSPEQYAWDMATEDERLEAINYALANLTDLDMRRFRDIEDGRISAPEWVMSICRRREDQ